MQTAMAQEIGQAPPGAAFPGQLMLEEYIHRAANDFAVACAEVYLAAREPSLQRMRDRIETASDRLYSLAKIQRILQPPRTVVMDLSRKLGDLCHHQARARFAEQGVFVRLRAHDVASFVVDSPRGWALLTIVSELLTNAARHAFDTPGGLVKVDIARYGEEIICVVRDDGVGTNGETTPARGGTAIIADLARRAGIYLQMHPCAVGTAFELRLAVNAI